MNDQALRDIILASGPIGYYPLDNINNLGNDISGYNNHGTQSGVFTQQSIPMLGMDILFTKGTASSLVTIPDRSEYRGSTITIEMLIGGLPSDNLVVFERGETNTNWGIQTLSPLQLSSALLPAIGMFLGSVKASGFFSSSIKLVSGFAYVVFTCVGAAFKGFLPATKSDTGDWTVTGSSNQSVQTVVPLNLYSRNGVFGFGGYLAHVAIYNRLLTDNEQLARFNLISANVNKNKLPISLSRANKETIQQSWPGENSCKQTASQTAKKAYGVTTAAMLNAPPLRKDFGFIEGVITRKTAPAVGQHVICLDDRFNLVAETLSGAGGHYRFDSLPINGLYAIHAYDNNEYKYAPVGADRRTPEAYA